MDYLSIILGICSADCKCLYAHIYIYRDKIMNDVKEYVRLFRLREKEEEREGEGCLCEWLE